MFAAAATGQGISKAPMRSEAASDPRAIVLAFYREALLERRPADAFAKYMAPQFVERKADVPLGTRQAVAKYLQDLIAELPESKWEVLRTVAEGPLVVVHARFTPSPGAAPLAIVDIFRVEGDFIVEHWDVVAHPPKQQVNPNSRF
jgi:predicted SnoaL-like aldol condensation-catalyzing enzyme